MVGQTRLPARSMLSATDCWRAMELDRPMEEAARAMEERGEPVPQKAEALAAAKGEVTPSKTSTDMLASWKGSQQAAGRFVGRSVRTATSCAARPRHAVSGAVRGSLGGTVPVAESTASQEAARASAPSSGGGQRARRGRRLCLLCACNNARAMHGRRSLEAACGRGGSGPADLRLPAAQLVVPPCAPSACRR